MIEEKRLIELGYSISIHNDNKFAIKYYDKENLDFAVIFYEDPKKPGHYLDDEIPFMDMAIFKSTYILKDFYARMSKAVKAYKKDMKELFKDENTGS